MGESGFFQAVTSTGYGNTLGAGFKRGLENIGTGRGFGMNIGDIFRIEFNTGDVGGFDTAGMSLMGILHMAYPVKVVAVTVAPNKLRSILLLFIFSNLYFKKLMFLVRRDSWKMWLM